MLLFEHGTYKIVILLLRHCAMSRGYGDNVESCYILLHLLGYKIFTQPGIYCPTYYCPNNIVILSLYRGDPYSRWPSKSSHHSSACTTHNKVQHKVYLLCTRDWMWDDGCWLRTDQATFFTHSLEKFHKIQINSNKLRKLWKKLMNDFLFSLLI